MGRLEQLKGLDLECVTSWPNWEHLICSFRDKSTYLYREWSESFGIVHKEKQFSIALRNWIFTLGLYFSRWNEKQLLFYWATLLHTIRTTGSQTPNSPLEMDLLGWFKCQVFSFPFCLKAVIDSDWFVLWLIDSNGWCWTFIITPAGFKYLIELVWLILH